MKYQVKLEGIEERVRALEIQSKWVQLNLAGLDVTAPGELQNRVHQFNSGRGLHL
jgi:hypothetical protein